MEKLIMIKYGELSTKKANINLFLKQLKDNLSFALEDLDVEIKFDKGRMFISLKKDNFEEVEKALNHVFGIHEYDIAYKFNDKKFDKIANFVLKLVKQKDFNTFKVVTKRSDKNYPISSMDFSRQIGAVILKNIEGVKVDIHEPELLVSIEIRMDAVYIYFNSKTNKMSFIPYDFDRCFGILKDWEI